MLGRRLLPALLLLGCVLSYAYAEDEDPAPPIVVPERVLLAAVETDPEGEATRLARDVRAVLAQGESELAALRLVALHARHPEVLLPLSSLGASVDDVADGALHWPVVRGVNHALVTLPPEAQARAFELWAPQVEALVARAKRGDDSALPRLARTFGATPDGSRALLLLAAEDVERGHLVEAARRYESWLALNPRAEPTRRAAVAVRLADALLAMDDAGGLRLLALQHVDLREVIVRGARGPTTLAARLADGRVAEALRHAAVEAPPAPRVALGDLADPVVLWSRPLRDADYLRQGMYGGALVVQAGAWGPDESTVLLHEGRVVRRLDGATGLERWRFPTTRAATLHDIVERYQGHDLPWRFVVPAGDAVLVALGEPNGSGRYEFLGEEYEADQLGQECRVRLVCLDIKTGALRWHSGAVDETHPVLGNRNTGLCSPPLVVGDDVYCLFARRDGATTFHLARLDLATGRPHFVTDLAGGDSGRDQDEAQGQRFTNPFAQSVPWGARPTLAGGEVCAVPHAGFAAGIAAADGRLRWVRALPRHAIDTEVVSASEGHSTQNAPVAFGDAWIVAPMDGPRMLCLARGSGAVRWQVGARTPDGRSPWRDLLGVRPDADGVPLLRLSGDAGLARIDPSDGARLHEDDQPWEVGEADPGGRVLDVGPYVLRATNDAIQVRPWQPNGVIEHDGAMLQPDGVGQPYAGDIVQIGKLWLVIGTERVAAMALPADVDGLLALPEGAAPDMRATRLALRARLTDDVRGLAAAVEAARSVRDDALRASVFARVTEDLREVLYSLEETDDELARLRSLTVVARTLPAAHRGPVLRDLMRRFFDLEAFKDGAALGLFWLAAADNALVSRDLRWDPLRQDRVRADLMAAALLRPHAAHPDVKPLLEAHERAAAARMAEARDASERELRRAIRLAAGTRAAAQGRRVLVRRLREAKRFVDAAAVTSDLRMDPPWAEATRPREERIRRAARLQMEEIALLADAGDSHRARTLAADLERWAPPDLLDRHGRDAMALAKALTKRFGWHPYEPDRPAEPWLFDVWKDRASPSDRDETRAVEFLALTGPGAQALSDRYVVLARGLTIEIWSLAERKLVTRLPGRDEGWFGGSLRSIDRWVPGGGILVTSLVAGEPADDSGVLDGDWVHTWSDEPVTDLPAFMQLVASSRPGARIPVGIWRQGTKVLTRFQAGRRPMGHGRLVSHEPVWVDERQRVLIPGRTGLTWVDPAKQLRTPHWSWSERGVVRHCVAVGGEVFVSINRSLLPDVLVCVDLETGRERWRVEAQGSITWFEPVGSALWVQTLSPGHGLLVDRVDGSLRARYRTFDRYRHAFRKTWQADREVGLAAGRAWVASGTDAKIDIQLVNATTAAGREVAGWRYGLAGGFRGRYVNPMVSSGAFTAIACQGGIRFLTADPLDEKPPHQLHANRRDLMGSETHHGAIDSNSRLFVRGHTLYLLRMPLQGRRNVNVHLFYIDYEELRNHEPTAQGGPGKVIWSPTHRMWLTGPASPYRYTMNIRAFFEGILVSAAQLSGAHRAESWWIACGPQLAREDNRDLRLLDRSMNEARRHAPKPVGARLFVAEDAGARVFPIQRYDRE